MIRVLSEWARNTVQRAAAKAVIEDLNALINRFILIDGNVTSNELLALQIIEKKYIA
jgi:hypothetical protein